MTTPGLSVVMIAKNSEQYLSVVLRSLVEVADEIVVVDTGSTDSTLDIAQKHGCRLFEFPWVDNFAMAKNFGIEQARFSWILNVDTDEVLYDKNARNIIISAMQDSAAPAYIIWQDNLHDSGQIESVKVLRLFRNDQRIRFTNPVHESIGELLYAHWPRFVPSVLDIHLRHYGHLPRNAHGKHARNIELMLKWTVSEPDNIFANYKLGTTLFEVKRYEESLPYLERTFKLFAESNDRESYPFWGVFIEQYSQLLSVMGLTDRALDMLKELH